MTRIARGLTEGELHHVHAVFGSALDHRRVRIHNRRAYFFQPDDIAMTPNGQVYFPPTSYKPDFSRTIPDAAWLIHELTHAWQHQQGMWVRLRGMLNRTYDYGDVGAAPRSFLRYGIEQQASIVADYFRLLHGHRPTRGAGPLAAYEALIPFTGGRAR